MKRVVVKFRDGNHVNLQADGIYQEGGFMVAYVRNDAQNTVKHGTVWETVGKFHDENVAAIYVSEKAE